MVRFDRTARKRRGRGPSILNRCASGLNQDPHDPAQAFGKAELFLTPPEQKCQSACKPGFVWPSALRRENVAAIHLGRMSPCASRNLPGRWTGNSPRRLPFAPPLFGLAPGGVYLAASVTGRAVGSYPTLSPLPHECGGLLSVALSLGSPPPAVSRHRVSMEPGLSSPAAFRHSRARPPGRLAWRIKGFMPENANEKAGRRAGFRQAVSMPARRAPPIAPSPCGNKPTTLRSCAWRRGRHCISGSCRRWCRR